MDSTPVLRLPLNGSLNVLHSPWFNGALLNLRLILKLGALVGWRPGASCPPPPLGCHDHQRNVYWRSLVQSLDSQTVTAVLEWYSINKPRGHSVIQLSLFHVDVIRAASFTLSRRLLDIRRLCIISTCAGWPANHDLIKYIQCYNHP